MINNFLKWLFHNTEYNKEKLEAEEYDKYRACIKSGYDQIDKAMEKIKEIKEVKEEEKKIPPDSEILKYFDLPHDVSLEECETLAREYIRRAVEHTEKRDKLCEHASVITEREEFTVNNPRVYCIDGEYWSIEKIMRYSNALKSMFNDCIETPNERNLFSLFNEGKDAKLTPFLRITHLKDVLGSPPDVDADAIDGDIIGCIRLYDEIYLTARNNSKLILSYLSYMVYNKISLKYSVQRSMYSVGATHYMNITKNVIVDGHVIELEATHARKGIIPKFNIRLQNEIKAENFDLEENNDE